MKKRFLAALAIGLTASVVMGLSALTAPAYSTVLTYDLIYEYSGADSPQGTTLPWVSLKFDDTVTYDVNKDGTNEAGVQLTIDASGLIGVEYLSQLDFNFADALSNQYFTFTYVSGIAATSTQANENLLTADGTGFFDIEFQYPTAAGSRLGINGESSTYFITYTDGGITSNSFNYLSTNTHGKKGYFHAAAHIQGIAINDEEDPTGGSGWIADRAPVPEPATMLLFGTGLAGLAGIARRRKKN